MIVHDSPADCIDSPRFMVYVVCLFSSRATFGESGIAINHDRKSALASSHLGRALLRKL